MKVSNLTSSLFLMVALFAISCSSKKVEQPKSLILYYSQTSNTKGIAEQIQTLVNADIEAIEAVVPYDGEYQQTIERGRKELDEGIFPEIKPLTHNVADYDIIYIGYPVWFGTYAPPIATLLNKIDLSGKKVVPFCTFGSGGLVSSSKDIAKNEPNADILPGYGVRAARLAAAAKELEQFLKRNGLLEGEAVKLAEFSPMVEATQQQDAILNEAIGDYPMMRGGMKADSVAYRSVEGGIEYLFIGRPIQAPAAQRGNMKIYVLHLDGSKPEFTQIVR